MGTSTEETIRIIDITDNADLICLWYCLSKEDNRIKSVFYADNDINIKYVLNWADRCYKIMGAFSIEDGLIGIGFVENPVRYSETKVRAEAGFGFTKKATIFTALESSRKMVDMVFNEFNIDYLFGTTPELNKKAIAFVKRLGLDLYGPIPNYCNYLGDISGCYTSYIDKERWNERRSIKSSTVVHRITE